MSHDLLPIAVLISGGGTTLKNLIDRKSTGNLPVDFRLVISSRSDAGGLAFAEQANIPIQVLPRSQYASTQDFSDAIFDACRLAQVQLVVMAGFLKHVLIPPDFRHRVINIHPSLIPSFCGAGFYGLRVHQAAIDYGVQVSGCTVHIVDDQYDHGPILLQRACPVLPDDTPESLQKRVFALECETLPDAIRLWSSQHRGRS